MSTSPHPKNYTSDFLELEPVGIARTITKTSEEQPSEPLDVEKEINSLFDLMDAQATTAAKPNHSPQATQPADQQLLEKITTAQALLDDLNQKSQVKTEAIEHSVTQAQQVQQRTEQLAKYSKQQVQQVQDMLKSFEEIRQEIVTALEKFGDFQQVQPMLQKMITAEQSLTQAHDQLQNYQTNLYTSLQKIQQQVEKRSATSESLLQQHKSELISLVSAVETDRQQMAVMQNSMAEQIQLSTELRNSLTEQATVFQHNLTDINTSFTELSASVQHEKQQFYQLTAGIINKADATQSKFSEIAKQVNKDWEAIQSLKFEIADLRLAFETEVKDQFTKLNQNHDEMVATWGDIKKKQNHLDQQQRSQQQKVQWLGIGLGILGVLVIFLLFRH